MNESPTYHSWTRGCSINHPFTVANLYNIVYAFKTLHCEYLQLESCFYCSFKIKTSFQRLISLFLVLAKSDWLLPETMKHTIFHRMLLLQLLWRSFKTLSHQSPQPASQVTRGESYCLLFPFPLPSLTSQPTSFSFFKDETSWDTTEGPLASVRQLLEILAWRTFWKAEQFCMVIDRQLGYTWVRTGYGIVCGPNLFPHPCHCHMSKVIWKMEFTGYFSLMDLDFLVISSLRIKQVCCGSW